MIIYKATNNINGKIYVGQTTKSLETRIKRHLQSVRAGSDTHFHQALRKYGKDNFTFEIVCEVSSKAELNRLETYYISKWNTIKLGYNMVDGGSNNVMFNKQIKQKQDAIMQTNEVRNKISNTMKQYRKSHPFSEETRRKISESQKGRKLDEARRKQCDTRSIGCYCILEDGSKLNFHSYRDAWKWWSTIYNPFDTKAECLYQRKIKQSIQFGYYTYHFNRNPTKYFYPKWFKKEGD